MPVHPRDGMQKRAFAALAMKQRIVKNDWSKVVLRVMIEAAQNAGAVFNPIKKEDKELSISSDLMPICLKVLVSAAAIRSGLSLIYLSSSEIDLIAKEYIHCSANWNSIVFDSKRKPYGGTSASETLGFVNRPDENWQRTTYNMDGNKE